MAWTPELDAQLLKLRSVDHEKWTVIEQEVGRPLATCQARYMKITDPLTRPSVVRRSTWSADDEARLMHMRFAERRKVIEIAVIMKRTRLSIDSKLRQMTSSPRLRTYTTSPRARTIPQDRLDDRDRRLIADRDITSVFFGDPPPGQSALDHKRALAVA